MQAWWLDTCFAQGMACELVGESVALWDALSPAQDPRVFCSEEPQGASSPWGQLHSSHAKLLLRRWTRGE